MSFHRMLLLAALMMFCTVGYAQNTQNNNRGVIINFIPEPAAQPLNLPTVPVYDGPSDFDKLMEKTDRQLKAIEAQESGWRAAAKYNGELLYSGENSFAEKTRYESCPRYHTKEVVNLRSKGSLKSTVIRQLPKGALVKLIDVSQPIYNSDGWWEVHVPGIEGTGYILAKYLTFGN